MEQSSAPPLRRVLPYFTIDGVRGSSQAWFPDAMMRYAGCAAITACDSSLYFDLHCGTALYPFRKNHLTRRDFIRFGMMMKPYLRPRQGGVDRLELYTEGYARFLADRGCRAIAMDPMPGEAGVSEAWEAVNARIDAGFPIPCLVLRHQNPAYRDYEWHWFLLIGRDALRREVLAVTYGQEHWLNFDAFWTTGYPRKGGLVLYRKEDSV